MKRFDNFSKGIIRENPVLALALGLCPALAVSSQVVNALGMGVGVIFVLTCSNIMVSLLKDFIPDEVRIPAYIVIIASFVTIVDMVMQAYFPALSRSLGVFVQLIVVNCVILGRAEAYASKNNVVDSILDALGMGLGFTLALVLISLVREVLGSGTITLFNLKIPGLYDSPARILALAAGALFVMGYLMAGFNRFAHWLEGFKKRLKGAE